MKTWIKRTLGVLGGVAALAAVIALVVAGYTAAVWDRPIARAAPDLHAPDDPTTIARGRHLYNFTAACWTCHGPAEEPTIDAPQAGGRVFDVTDVGPGFGVYYGSNLTSDPETGLGQWTDGEVVRAIREGIDRDNHLLFPVMAYPLFHGMSDDDVLAIVAYLRTLPPVRHAVPRRVVSFPAKALMALGVLKPAPAVVGRVEAPPRAVTAQYGEYLAWHVSGCAECHMPRSPRDGSFDLTRPMAGGLFPFPEPLVEVTGSNLTPDPRTGIGNWTEAQFLAAMRTGTRPDGQVMTTFMPWPLYGQWPEDDLKAVWLYLRSVAPQEHEVPRGHLAGAAASGHGAPHGRALYEVYCLTCHGRGGEGTPLTDRVLSDRIDNDDAEGVAETITHGFGPRKPRMPAFGQTLSEQQIADIITYLKSAPRAPLTLR